MKNIEVFCSDADGSMSIKIDGFQFSLTMAEASYLDSMMARASTSFKIVNDPDADPPGAPLTKIRPVRIGF